MQPFEEGGEHLMREAIGGTQWHSMAFEALDGTRWRSMAISGDRWG